LIIVSDASRQALAHVYFEGEPARRSVSGKSDELIREWWFLTSQLEIIAGEIRVGRFGVAARRLRNRQEPLQLGVWRRKPSARHPQAGNDF
jgi:hypothetical protein